MIALPFGSNGLGTWHDMKYRIGSRGSKLALAQTELIRKRLEKENPGDEFEIVVIRTSGDKIQNKPLSSIGVKGLFVREIEEMLLDKKIDIAVHSMKDMPGEIPEGLYFTKVWKREDPRDVLILRKKKSLEELPENAVIGTGSKRRAYMLKMLRPDLRIVDIRGNIETRIRKMHELKLDGLILASAGFRRLGLENMITQYMSIDEVVPAPAQGALAIEVCRERRDVISMLDLLSDEESDLEIEAERNFLIRMGGGCRMPVGACCSRNDDGSFSMTAMFGREDGSRIAKVTVNGATPGETAKNAELAIRKEMAGLVHIVGAGPGDPSLITVKGMDAIKNADCIVYDRLVSPVLLGNARSGCEMIYVGKENHNHTMHQDEINALLVSKAMEYDNVVRLKGGDPFVFGRGGEEALYLTAHSVSYEYVPGVSSCIAAPASAGIPVTHRGMAGGFEVVTAHNRNGEFAALDFKQMASSGNTLVFLMGFSKIKEIAERLIENGADPECPAAVISEACMPGQRTAVGTLSDIFEKSTAAGLNAPAVLVAGRVASLNQMLGNIQESENTSHLSREVWVPRTGDNRITAGRLARRGIITLEPAVGRIDLCDISIDPEEIRNADCLIFTGRNGAESFSKYSKKMKMDPAELAGSCKIASVGKRTSESLERIGLNVDIEPEKGNAEALFEILKNELSENDKAFYFSGENASCIDELKNICRFSKITAYRNTDLTLKDELRPGRGKISEMHIREDAIGVFTCASGAARFMGMFEKNETEQWKKHGTAFSIGSSTTALLKEAGVKNIFQSEFPDGRILADMVYDYLMLRDKS
jgi:uroporphyrinogen III methyltransferase/synthase